MNTEFVLDTKASPLAATPAARHRPPSCPCPAALACCPQPLAFWRGWGWVLGGTGRRGRGAGRLGRVWARAKELYISYTLLGITLLVFALSGFFKRCGHQSGHGSFRPRADRPAGGTARRVRPARARAATMLAIAMHDTPVTRDGLSVPCPAGAPPGFLA
jgi:hypothetical protein